MARGRRRRGDRSRFHRVGQRLSVQLAAGAIELVEVVGQPDGPSGDDQDVLLDGPRPRRYRRQTGTGEEVGAGRLRQGEQRPRLHRALAPFEHRHAAQGDPSPDAELGPSAGLNLLWDRYRYVYRAGTWGASGSPVVLRGEELHPVPADMLQLLKALRDDAAIANAPR